VQMMRRRPWRKQDYRAAKSRLPLRATDLRAPVRSVAVGVSVGVSSVLALVVVMGRTRVVEDVLVVLVVLEEVSVPVGVVEIEDKVPPPPWRGSSTA